LRGYSISAQKVLKNFSLLSFALASSDFDFV